MKVMIVGAAGMLGRKLSARIAVEGIGGQAVDSLVLADVVTPDKPPTRTVVETHAIDLAAPGSAERLVRDRPDLIFHLAAVVSGEAEADLEKGYRVNLDGTRALLEAIRLAGDSGGYCPRVVFTSSLAVFGEPLPDLIEDTFITTPLTSYGTQKAIGELLLSDYSRRGFLDGIALRLPTIVIRPGKPNRAASGFFSSILREPLAGQEAVLPVDVGLRHWFASPRAAVGFLLHAATLDTSLLGARRALTLPGLSATVADEIEALRRAAGDKAVRLIRHPAIERIVAGWPRSFRTERAEALGFRAEASFDEIIRIYVEDDLDAPIAA
jgi:nucleoside-diphosphate-sugar epimerase